MSLRGRRHMGEQMHITFVGRCDVHRQWAERRISRRPEQARCFSVGQPISAETTRQMGSNELGRPRVLAQYSRLGIGWTVGAEASISLIGNNDVADEDFRARHPLVHNPCRCGFR